MMKIFGRTGAPSFPPFFTDSSASQLAAFEGESSSRREQKVKRAKGLLWSRDVDCSHQSSSCLKPSVSSVTNDLSEFTLCGWTRRAIFVRVDWFARDGYSVAQLGA